MVTFSFGTVAVGQTVTATVTAQAHRGRQSDQHGVGHEQPVRCNLNNNTAWRPIAVAEPPIVVSSPITVSGKNQSNVQVATFTHANGVEPASDFVATINWGDGTTSTGSISQSESSYRVKGSHTYSASGSHTVTTTVVESESSNQMHALAVTNSSMPSAPTNVTPAIVQGQTTGTAGSPPTLKKTVVDEVLSSPAISRARHALHPAVNDAVLDDLLAWG